MNDIINLVKIIVTINEYGEKIETIQERYVFGELKSVGQREFYQAMANNIVLDVKFIISDYYDYKGEEFASYGGKKFKILKTYRTNTNSLELTLQEVYSYGTT